MPVATADSIISMTHDIADMADVREQHHARRALDIAADGYRADTGKRHHTIDQPPGLDLSQWKNTTI